MKLLLLVPVLFGLVTDVSRELRKATPAEQAEIIGGLAKRMEGLPRTERAALLPLLKSLLRDEGSHHMHVPALGALLATGTGGGTMEVLRRAYSREESYMRAAARAALAEDRSQDVTKHLLSSFRLEQSSRARAWIAHFLGLRGRASLSASKVLVDALARDSFLVRGAAAEALTRIWGSSAGYDRTAWEKVLEGTSAPSAAPEPEANPGSKPEPGDTVTKPPPVPEPETLVGDLVPRYHGIPLDRSVIVAVVDISGSVRGPSGKAARNELVRKLSLLPSTRRFTVLAFDERLLRLFNKPERALPDSKVDLETFVRKLPPGGKTEMLLPVHVALGLAGEVERGDAQVLIVSDGWQTEAGPPVRLAETAQKLAAKGVRVDVAALRGAEVGLFRYLTRVTNGHYVPIR